MEIRSHTAARGCQWLVSGAALFRRHSGLWLVILGASFLALKTLLLIPFTAPLFLVAMPVVLAGMMELCRAIEFGKPPAFGYLLAGFTRNTRALLLLGALSITCNLLVLATMMALGGDALQEIIRLSTQQQLTPEQIEQIRASAPEVLTAMLAGWVLSVVVMMALWFAPLLVYFDGLPPLVAMRASLVACYRNPGAFFVYGLVLFAVMVVAMPMAMAARMLDLGLWLLAPVVVPSIYAYYRDIFVTPEEPADAESIQD